jgi:protein phosphatase
MRPIRDDERLSPGDTLFHTAFGFARVGATDDDEVALAWESGGGHLPPTITTEAARRVYLRCPPGGFFHRTVHDLDALRDDLHTNPAEVLVALLDDLEEPQRARDIMDWLIGRNLLTAKTFVRWWGISESMLRADARLELDGEWVRRRDVDAPLKLTQLEPDLVAPDPNVDDADVGVVEDDPEPPPSRLTALVDPIALVEARPPARTLPSVGLALARALRDAHAVGRHLAPTALNTTLLPDGSVRVGDFDAAADPVTGEVRHGSIPGDAAPEVTWPALTAADVRAAACVLLEAYTGRSLPPTIEPGDVLPHLRHRLPDAPPSSLAPLFAALDRNAALRPSAEAWARQWDEVVRAEADREANADPARAVTVGYDSHIGRMKLLHNQVNQDSLYLGTRGANRLLVLADGISVSDAGRGDLASRLTTTAIGRLWENIPDDHIRPRRLLERALHLANRTVCERSLRIANGDLRQRLPMGTTVVACLMLGNRAHLAWLGDSRAYLVGPYGISLLTADDNVSGERFQLWCDGLSRSWSPSGHALVRYVGHFDEDQTPAPFPSHRAELVLRPGERLVICSDGITDYIDPTEPGVARRMWECCHDGDPDEACRRLVNLANRLGGGDNASAMVVIP